MIYQQPEEIEETRTEETEEIKEEYSHDVVNDTTFNGYYDEYGTYWREQEIKSDNNL